MASCDNEAPKRGRLDDGFKQRIVGALVLAALAVIFLPSLFDREGARYIDVTSQIPEPPQIQPIQIAEPQPVEGIAAAPDPDSLFQPEADPEPVAEPEPAVKAPQPAPSPAVAQVEPAKPAAPAPTKAVPAEKPAILDASGLPHAWVVQVASYSQADRAGQMRDRLLGEGYRAFVRPVTTDRGRFVRVFVGPKAEKAEAQGVKQELDQLLGLKTLVMRFKA